MPESNWHAVVLFPRRNLDPPLPVHFEALKDRHLSVIYLDEIPPPEAPTPEMSLVEIIAAPEEDAVAAAHRLRDELRDLEAVETMEAAKAAEEPGRVSVSRTIRELLATILLYKFGTMSREEIEAMFQLGDIRQTRVFQEALEEGEAKGKLEGKLEGRRQGKLEGKLEMIPLLLQLGLSVENIARELGVSVQAVRVAAVKPRNPSQNGAAQEQD